MVSWFGWQLFTLREGSKTRSSYLYADDDQTQRDWLANQTG